LGGGPKLFGGANLGEIGPFLGQLENSTGDNSPKKRLFPREKKW